SGIGGLLPPSVNAYSVIPPDVVAGTIRSISLILCRVRFNVGLLAEFTLTLFGLSANAPTKPSLLDVPVTRLVTDQNVSPLSTITPALARCGKYVVVRTTLAMAIVEKILIRHLL